MRHLWLAALLLLSGTACDKEDKNLRRSGSNDVKMQLPEDTSESLEQTDDKPTAEELELAEVVRKIAAEQTIKTSESISATLAAWPERLIGRSLRFTLISAPMTGAQIIPPEEDKNVLTYKPKIQFSGSDQFKFRIELLSGKKKKILASREILVKVNIDAKPLPPEAVGGEYSAQSGVELSALLQVKDPDSKNLNFEILSPTTMGILRLNPTTGAFTYLFNDPTVKDKFDTFAYKVTDDTGLSATATGTIKLNAVNLAPVALAESLEVNEDNLLMANLLGEDPNMDSISFKLVAPPKLGSVTLTDFATGSFVYEPKADVSGNDSFTFQVSDGQLLSAVAEIKIKILAVQDTPSLEAVAALDIAEDTPGTIELKGSDPDGDSVSYMVIQPPSHGVLEENWPSLTYHPDLNFYGADSFIVVATDGVFNSLAQQVTVNVQSVDDIPLCLDGSAASLDDALITMQLVCSDADHTVANYELVEMPEKAESIQIDPTTGILQYRAKKGSKGTDRLTFKAKGGDKESNTAEVMFELEQSNIKPVASGVTIACDEDSAFCNGDLQGSDVNLGDQLVYEIVEKPLHSKFHLFYPHSGAFTLVPDANYFGSDRFTYRISDGQLISEIATVNITYLSVNDLPVLQEIGLISTHEDQATTFDVLVSDVDDQELTVKMLSTPQRGSVQIGPVSDGKVQVTYTPQANQNGSDSFALQACDAKPNGCGTALLVQVSIVPVNDPPIAGDVQVVTTEDTEVRIDLIGTDVDSEHLIFAINSQSAKGHVVLDVSTGAVLYQPLANLVDRDSFSYTVTDPSGASATGNVTITINPVNDRPVAQSGQFNVREDTQLFGQLAAYDAESSALTFSISVAPSHGAVALQSNGQFIYTPAANFSGVDQFSFTVSDGVLVSGAAVTSITIEPVNDAPVLVLSKLTARSGKIFTTTLQATDPDSDDDLLFSIVKPASEVKASIMASTLTVDIPESVRGTISMGVRVTDREGAFADGTITISVKATQDLVTAVYAGELYSCALFRSARVKCWGDNAFGQLGLGDTKARGDQPGEMGLSLPYINVGTGRTVRELALGRYHTCALLDNNAVKCWGHNLMGELGLGNTVMRGDSTASGHEMGDSLPAVNLGVGKTAKQIAAGALHTCAILQDNSVKCWGGNESGQLGLGTKSEIGKTDPGPAMGDALPKVNLGASRTAKQISAGASHTCAVLDNNSVKCWGGNAFGQLGLGNNVNRGDSSAAGHEMGDSLAAVNLGLNKTAKKVVAGMSHSCAILNDSSVKCWGANTFGQLGQGNTVNRGDGSAAGHEMGDQLPAVNLGTGRTAVDISTPVSFHQVCAVLDNSTLKCWGINTYGALGQGDTVSRGDSAATGHEMGSTLLPVNLGTNVTVAKVATGIHGCALVNKGGVKCWGYNYSGQLGLGNTVVRGDSKEAGHELGDLLPIVAFQ